MFAVEQYVATAFTKCATFALFAPS